LGSLEAYSVLLQNFFFEIQAAVQQQCSSADLKIPDSFLFMVQVSGKNEKPRKKNRVPFLVQAGFDTWMPHRCYTTWQRQKDNCNF
jgi:hypothetical protein